MRNRVKEIEQRNYFKMMTGNSDTNHCQTNTGFQGMPPIDFNKIRVGAQTLEDAIIEIGLLKKVNPRLADKKLVLDAINKGDVKTMREISEFFYKTSGIYARILRYMAFMYRYDWYITPIKRDDNFKDAKLKEGFYKALDILDNYNVKKQLGEIALNILKYGCYYAYKIPQGGTFMLQELPPDYCRSRYKQGDRPVIEFNMKFFDDNFRDAEYRLRVLKLFPKEFTKGYRLYKQGKLPKDFAGDDSGWYMLDPASTVKFTANGENYPAFISVIPLILDLDEAQDLDRKKTLQRLLKIVIQKMPLDKNGDLIFDVEEAQQLHNNAVQMLGRAIGVDVLTTFAEVEVADLADKGVSSAQTDDLERIERQLFNEAGVSQMQFNTDGNIALEKSILNDEACMYNMLLQFEVFLNDLIKCCNGNKKVCYRVQLLTTTIYNYQELSKLYKEQMQLGFSKMLPQIALGQSQSSILSNAYFENEVLDLVNVFIPPLMSSTMNVDILNRNKGGGDAQGKPGESSDGAGRKELPDEKKSEKTIMNKESSN